MGAWPRGVDPCGQQFSIGYSTQRETVSLPEPLRIEGGFDPLLCSDRRYAEGHPEGLYYNQLHRLESVLELGGPDRSTRHHLTVCNYGLETQRTDVYKGLVCWF
jgi:hypothetical protein